MLWEFLFHVVLISSSTSRIIECKETICKLSLLIGPRPGYLANSSTFLTLTRSLRPKRWSYSSGHMGISNNAKNPFKIIVEKIQNYQFFLCGKKWILVVLKIFYDNFKGIFRVVAEPHITAALAHSLAEAPSKPPLRFARNNVQIYVYIYMC